MENSSDSDAGSILLYQCPDVLRSRSRSRSRSIILGTTTRPRVNYDLKSDTESFEESSGIRLIREDHEHLPSFLCQNQENGDLERQSKGTRRASSELEQRSEGRRRVSGELERRPCLRERGSGELERRSLRRERENGELERRSLQRKRRNGELEQRFLRCGKESDELERRSVQRQRGSDELEKRSLQRRRESGELERRPLRREGRSGELERHSFHQDNYTCHRSEECFRDCGRLEDPSRRNYEAPRRQRRRSTSPSPGPVPRKHKRSSNGESSEPFFYTPREETCNNKLVKQFIEAIKDMSKNSSRKLTSVHNVIPEFDPLSKNQNVISWLTKVEECAQIYDWDERETIHYALPKLGGVAKSWYDSLPTLKYTWTEWKNKLITSFPCRENFAELLVDMLSLKAKFGDSLEEYFYSKLNLLNRCQITGRKAVDCLLHGVEDRSIKLGAQAVQFNTPEQVLKYFKSVKSKLPKETLTNYTNRNKIGKRPTIDINPNQPSTSKGPIKCFNCGKEGHPSFLCPKPIVKCTNCRRLGHDITSCSFIPSEKKLPTKNNDEHSQKKILKIAVDNFPTSDAPADKYSINIKVNNLLLSCYVDLGSECSLIQNTAALSLGTPYNTHNLPLLKGLGSSLVHPLACIRTVVNVQGIVLPIDMYVVDDEVLKNCVLLGQNFTEQPSITITKTPTQLIFEVTNTRRLFITVQGDTKILVNEIRPLPVKSGTSYNGKIYVDGSIRGEFGKEYYLLPGEYELSNGSGHVLIQNLSSNDLTFDNNSLITRATAIIKNISNVCSLKLMDASVDNCDDNINCGDVITDGQKQKLQELLTEYKDCFSKNLRDLGFTHVTEMTINLKDAEPVVYRPYRMSYSERKVVQEMVQEMIDANIVRESNSPYASPIVLVKKKTGEKRLCVDFRALNRKTIKAHYPLPRVEDQLDLLSGHSLFITLDLASGYYQIPIAEESIPKTAFVTPDGQFEYLRMPFGLVNAPSVFQSTINKILSEAKIKFAMVYMDDILIPAVNFSQGLSRLREVLELLRKGGLTLKLSKCHFFYDTIEYLGFEVSSGGIRPGNCKTESVSKFPPPKNQHELRQFLGLVNYFRRFVKNFAVIARPLTDLLKNSVMWTWTDKQIDAFECLKKHLINRPILALYNPDAETELHTDASKIGVAGILFQKDQQGILRPVSYYSRKTSIDEQKFHSFELETLAVIASLNRFRVYLIGIHFKIYTDCNALRTTLTKRDLVPRIARWWVQMQEFDCEIEYRPGIRMAHVDALSRNPIENSFDETHVLDVLTINTEDWLSTVQESDDEIKCIKEILSNPTSERVIDIHKNYMFKNKRVYRKIGDTCRWVVPKGVRWQILKMNHDDIGHFGFDKTLARLKENYWFPKMRRFVKKYVTACLECAHHKAQGGPKNGELHLIPKIEIPFHTVHADHLGPFVRSKRGNSYLLVIIDGFTKYINIKPVRNTKSSTTIRVFKDHISYFGTPTRLITDRGSSFTSHAFKSFIKSTGIKHILNAVATPRANGQVERFNRTILDALATKTHAKDDRTWDEYIPDVQLGLNTSIHTITKKSPSELLFGHRLISTKESILHEIIEDTQNTTPAENLPELRQEVSESIKLQQEKDKKRLNKNVKKRVNYNVGDLVRVKREISQNDGKSKKLIPKYQGPYRVKKILPHDRFVIEDTPVTRKNNRRYEAIVAGDKIRPWMSFSTDYISSCEGSDTSDVDDLDNGEN